jgi:hypothetical protein
MHLPVVTVCPDAHQKGSTWCSLIATGAGQASEATPEDAAMHARPAALPESMVLALLIRASGSRYSGGLFQLPVPELYGLALRSMELTRPIRIYS